MNDYPERSRLACLPWRTRRSQQLQALNRLLGEILPGNRFYSDKLAQRGSPGPPLTDFAELAAFPFTYKSELQDHPQVGPAGGLGGAILPANLTYGLEKYVRYHQTSGTRGRPLTVLDSREDWRWWIDAWQFVLDAAQIEAGDRAVLAFSFGPFIGFWSAFDALVHRGVMAIPGGGLSSIARLELMRTTEAEIVFCTPSYALHLAEVGREHQLRVADLPVQKVVVAGEPGGSVPAIRHAIEDAWQARLIDHCGASEVGPWGLPAPDGSGLFINEHHWIAEFRSLESDQPASENELSELVLTTLGRAGAPVIRYRTGDLVRPTYQHTYQNTWVYLPGGVLGRVDDMLIIRGVNIFPSSIEQILRSFPEIVEYRMTAFKQGHLDSLRIEVEDRMEQPARIAQELLVRLNLKVEVKAVPIGSLPRYELKGRRFQDQRSAAAP
jgi:phenylacetate-CoA ligase